MPRLAALAVERSLIIIYFTQHCLKVHIVLPTTVKTNFM